MVTLTIQSNQIAEIKQILDMIKQQDKRQKSFTIIEDLTIIFEIYRYGEANPNIRGICKTLSGKLNRTEESVRERYRKKLKFYTPQRVQEMCLFLKEKKADSTYEFDRDGKIIHGGRQHKKKDDQLSRTNSRKQIIKIDDDITTEKRKVSADSSDSDVQEIPKKPEPAPISTLIFKNKPQINIQKYSFKRNRHKVHQLYEQPTEVFATVSQIAQRVELPPTDVYEMLDRCSMSLELFERCLRDPQQSKTIMWDAQEDEILMMNLSSDIYRRVFEKNKGVQNVQRRIRYLQK